MIRLVAMLLAYRFAREMDKANHGVADRGRWFEQNYQWMYGLLTKPVIGRFDTSNPNRQTPK